MLYTGYWIPCVFVVAFILLFIVYLCLSCCRRWGWADRMYVKVGNFGVNMFLRFANVLFGPPQVIMNFEPARDITTDDIYIEKNQVSKHLVIFMFNVYAVVVCVFIMMATWNDFLFKITDSCTPTSDCFAFINNGSTTEPTPEPITNCSDYSNSDYSNSTVEINCFVFTFSFTSALATFGGLMTAIRYLSIVIFKVQFWINRTLCNSNNCIKYVIFLGFLNLSVFFLGGNLIFIRLTEKFIAKTLANFVHRLTFSVCVLCLCSCPIIHYYQFRHYPRFRPNPPQTPASLEANRETINETNDERQPLLSGADNV